MVHFDRLKPCPSNMRLNNSTQSGPPQADEQPSLLPNDIQPPTQAPTIRKDLQLVEDDDDNIQQEQAMSAPNTVHPPRRYPRHPPTRYDV